MPVPNWICSKNSRAILNSTVDIVAAAGSNPFHFIFTLKLAVVMTAILDLDLEEGH